MRPSLHLREWTYYVLIYYATTATLLFSCADIVNLANWSSFPVQHPAWFELHENSTATFTCGCSSDPDTATNIYWQRSTRIGNMYEWLSGDLSSWNHNQEQANSTLMVHAIADSFGLLYRCICSNIISNHMSTAAELRFVRMHRHEYIIKLMRSNLYAFFSHSLKNLPLCPFFRIQCFEYYQHKFLICSQSSKYRQMSWIERVYSMWEQEALRKK